MPKKRKKRKQNKSRHSGRKTRTASKRRNAILLPAVLSEKEQAKIKSKAFQSCRRAWKSIDKTEGELSDYYSGDLKAFDTWQQGVVFPWENKLRKLSQSARDDFELLRSIQEAAFRYHLNAAQAYLLVTSKEYQELLKEERENFSSSSQQNFSFGEQQEGFDEDENQCDCEFCRAESEEEDDANYDFDSTFFESDFGQEIKQRLKGINTLEEARVVLEKFFNKTLGRQFSNPTIRGAFIDDFILSLFQSGEFRKFLGLDSGEDPNTVDPQITQIYRALAKELHPDLNKSLGVSAENGGFNKQRSELWLQLQDAYRRRDLPLLRNIRVRFEVFIKNSKEVEVSVAELIDVRDELRLVNKSKRNSIRKFRKGPVWGFSKFSDKEIESLNKEKISDFKQQEKIIKSGLLDLKKDLVEIKKSSRKYKKDLKDLLALAKKTQGDESGFSFSKFGGM